MNAELIGKYINTKRIENNLTYSAIAEICNVSESTVKGLCLGKTENPSMATIGPIMDAVGGSFDEMFHPEKTKDEVKEASVLALKDVYEFQLASLKETNETNVNNIRSHYERQIADTKENNNKIIEQYEKRLANQDEQIKRLEKSNLHKTIVIGFLVAIFITLFIMEILHPEHGWLRY